MPCFVNPLQTLFDNPLRAELISVYFEQFSLNFSLTCLKMELWIERIIILVQPVSDGLLNIWRVRSFAGDFIDQNMFVLKCFTDIMQ